MLRHKNIDRLCCAVLAATLLLTCGFMGAAAGGLIEGESSIGYEKRLFDPSCVHTIDIVMNDWEGFIETCTDEEYAACTVVVDGERFANVAIRAKGNTSLSQVASYGNDRYSFKIEFDHYDSAKSFYGLDKLCLNNLIQDKTLMKDYLAYTLMNRMGVAAPLCSFVQVNVNGEPWGLYLAVEAVEDGFLSRNYGGSGDLYKPDSLSMGGGRGNGRDFDMGDFDMDGLEMPDAGAGEVEMPGFGGDGANVRDIFSETVDWSALLGEDFDVRTLLSGDFRLSDYVDETFDPAQLFSDSFDPTRYFGEDFEYSDMLSDDFDWSPLVTAVMGGMRGDMERPDAGGGMDFGGMGSSDVKLQYIDDDPDSYANIFGSAKTDVTQADQARLIESLRKLSEGTLDEKLEAVDAEAVMRYLVVHSFMDNGDSYTGSMVHNYYLYERDGRLSMIPWDYNLSFGAFSMGGSSGATDSVNTPIDSPVTSGGIESRPILSWIFESEEYTEQYHAIYREFVESVYSGGWLDQEIRRVADMIAPYVAADENGFYSYEEFQTAVQTLCEYCSLKGESIEGQLDGTVPATSEAQKADPNALIDAEHVSLSDMGDFNMGGGHGGDRTQDRSEFGFGGGMPDMGGKPDAEGQSDAGMPDMGEQGGAGMPDMGGKPDAEGQNDAGMPDMGEQGGAGMPDMGGQGEFGKPDAEGQSDAGMPDMGEQGGAGMPDMGGKPDAEGQSDAGMPDMGEQGGAGMPDMGGKPDAEGQSAAGMPDMTEQGGAGAPDAKGQPGSDSAHERKDNRGDFAAKAPDAASGGRESWLMLAGCAAVLLAAIIAVLRYSSRR